MANLRRLFGNRIREFRKAKRLSQQGLAAKAGLHYTYVGSVERGESNISFDNMVKIADALEMPLKELFTFPINNQPITEIERLRAEIAALFEGKNCEKLKLSLRVLNAIFEEG
jgi:transcriptional regulator with XRE-family HTH domain